MKKTRFFYLKKINVFLLILWLGIINEALVLNLHREQNTTPSDVGTGSIEEDAQEVLRDLEETQGSGMTELRMEQLPENAKSIRVLLMDSAYQSYYHPEVSVVYDGKEETYTVASDALKDGELILECDGEGITISSIKRQQGNPTYQGSLEIKKSEQGLLLINEVPVETYLESVVPSEMPASYEKEALKAQAICARTYAYKQMEKGNLKEYDADVDDSVNFQVYGNVPDQSSTSEAVRETAGQVLYQDKKLIEAYYFSTSAGKTSTNEVWGIQETASYLKSVECSFDSDEVWSDWNVVIPWENMERSLQTLYHPHAELINLQVNRKSQSGAAIEMTAVTTQGNYLIEGEYNIRAFLTPEGCEILMDHGMKQDGGALLPSAYFDMELTAGETVKITGKGYGHGVGMSQNAADEMAKEGYTCEEILKYFFNDVEIKDYV